MCQEGEEKELFENRKYPSLTLNRLTARLDGRDTPLVHEELRTMPSFVLT